LLNNSTNQTYLYSSRKISLYSVLTTHSHRYQTK